MKRICCLLWFGLLVGCEPFNLDSFIYDAQKAPPGDYDLSKEVIPAFEEMTIRTSDGEDIFAVWIPGSGPKNDVSLIYCRGQGGNIGISWPRIEFLYPTGYNILVVDYRGFGKSTGTPSEAGIRIDMLAVRDAIITQKGADPEKIVYYGRSFGGAVAIDLASVKPPAILIEESTFTSIQDFVSDSSNADLQASALVNAKWDNLAKIGHISVPFLAVHGKLDDYVPPKYSQALYDAHPGPKKLEWVPNADHFNVPQTIGEDQYVQLVTGFVAEYLK